MKLKNAISALSALSQETRLSAFRVLVNQGPEGMPAGEIAQRLNVPPATLSFHLRELENAGLLRSRRQSRQIYYSADFAGMRSLLDFLMADCCGGHPEICDPVRARPRAGVIEGA